MSRRNQILLIILIVLAFFALRLLLPALTGSADDPVQPAETAETITDGDLQPETDGGIVWNYDEFPEDYTFRSQKYRNEHYEKHGIDMGFESAEDYEAAANLIIHHPDVLHKIEKEDGDTCFYLESVNAFVVLSKDGYIRTFFCPDSGKKYYDRQ